MKESVNSKALANLPIFQVTGETAARQTCIDYVENSFRLAHLRVFVVKNTNISGHELHLLSHRYDLVLVDGEVDFDVHRINTKEPQTPLTFELFFDKEDPSQQEEFCDQLLEKLTAFEENTPVWACILIGGKSSRMGQPKHLLKSVGGGDESWLEGTVRKVEPFVDGLILSGKGVIPEPLEGVVRLPDIPGVAGPLTGLLSAMRWQPEVNWLVLACDMPFIEESAIRWLLSVNVPGCWGKIPRLADNDFCEPLFAFYSHRALQLLEEQLLDGNLRVGKIAAHHKIDNPVIPDYLALAWKNVNTPEQLRTLQKK